MIIGIDGYEANTNHRVGIGQYAYQLLSQFSKNKDQQFIIYLPFSPNSNMPKEENHWKYIVANSAKFWTMYTLPKLISKTKLDIFFSPTHYSPWLIKLPKAISIMDVSYMEYASMFKWNDLIKLKYMGRYSIKRAQKIFTISNYSKSKINEYYNYPLNNIVVTYPGYSKINIKNIKPLTCIANIINTKYILFVGTLQPRKNLINLISAFEKITADIKLVIVGKKGWLYDSIFSRISCSLKKDKIIYLEYISDVDVTYLYTHAICCILPSLSEGFGLPILEAMGNNCPVAVSNSSSLPEVVGKAGFYFNPRNVNDIAHTLIRVTRLTKKERLDIIELGKKQAQLFSWENCAKITLNNLKEMKQK